MKHSKYQKYKDSGIAWLGEIPNHWKVTKAKQIWQKENRPIRDEDEIITAFRDGEVTLRKNRREDGFTVSLKEIGYQGVRKNDLVIHQMDAFAGAIGVSDSDGKCTPVYSICTPRIPANPHFYNLLLREMSRSKYILSLAKGIRERSTDFRFNMFGELEVPLPPKQEQTTIAKFLKYKTEQIEYFIKKKKRLLELSIERRKSLTRSITQSNNVKFLRISRVAPLIHRTIERELNEVYIPVGLYNRGRGIFHKPETLGKDLGDSTFYRIKEGDVILSGQFAWEGSVALAKKNDEDCIASHRYPILKCNEDYIIPEFLFSFFTISEGHFFLEINSVGAAGRNRPLNPRKLIKEKIPVPSLEEQSELIEIIKKEDSLKKLIEKEITLVEEYKTALIAEAVTGKIDVRDFKILTQETPLAMVAEQANNFSKENN